MKFCVKCGNPMDDDMLYCQKCGTKSPIEPEKTLDNDNVESSFESETKSEIESVQESSEESRVPRKSMCIWRNVFFFFTAFSLVSSINDALSIAMSVFFLILALMFWVLSRVPKEQNYVFGKITKKSFVIFCVAIGFLSYVALFELTFPEEQNIQTTTEQQETNMTSTGVETSFEDVKHWYEVNKTLVSDEFATYLGSTSINVDGVETKAENIKIDDISFRFGEEDGFYDCYYLINFSCTIHEADATGHTRGFLEYQGDKVTWWSLEIDQGDKVLLDQYDEEYDTIIENYYKSLKEQYK